MKRLLLFILISLLLIGTMACQLAIKSNLYPLDESPSDTSEDTSTSQNTPQDTDDIKTEKNLELEKNAEENNMEANANEGENTADVEKSESQIATLYFGDSQVMYLVAEERIVTDITPEILINELIKGPQDVNNNKTIPEGTKLLGIEVKNGIAYVNFSKELKDNHWGGSTGETFTIYSIVNTLVLQPNSDIERVQILIEGQTIETLAGHADISMPIEPDLRMVDMK